MCFHSLSTERVQTRQHLGSNEHAQHSDRKELRVLRGRDSAFWQVRLKYLLVPKNKEGLKNGRGQVTGLQEASQ